MVGVNESPTMVLLDCGTGESKLYLTHQAGIDDLGRPIVANDQMGDVINSAKGSYESLKTGKSSDFASQYEDRLKLALEKAKGLSKTPVRVTVGLTAWWRKFKAEDRMRCYTELFAPLEKITEDISRSVLGKSIDVQVETIRGLDEAKFESIAVEYAVERVFKVNTLDMIMSGGKGSIQFSPVGEHDSNVGANSVALDMKRGEAVVTKLGTEAWRAECDVMLGQEVYVYKELLRKRLEDNPAQPIIVVVISAFFYGAKAAGLVEKEPKKWVLKDAITQLDKFLNGEAKASDRANLIRMKTCFSLMFPCQEHWSNIEVVFARDWKVEGQDFRTTWTSGYFIEYLKDPETHPTYSEFNKTAQLRFKKVLENEANDVVLAGGCGGTVPSAMQWVQLISGGKVHECISMFDDLDDEDTWRVPATQRSAMIAKLKCGEQHLQCPDSEKVGGWARFAASTSLMGPGADCGGIGISIFYIPGGKVESTMIAAGFLSSQDSNPGPPPTLGHQKVTEWLHPVFDVGVLFNAADAGGSVRLQIGSSVQNELCKWNPDLPATYELWIQEGPGGTQVIKFSHNKLIEYTFELVDPWKLRLPAMAHVWVGPTGGGGDPEDIPTVEVSWIGTTPGCCESMRWGVGRVRKSMRLVWGFLRNTAKHLVPASIYDSAHRFHSGNGIRFVASWPTRFSSCASLPADTLQGQSSTGDPESGRRNFDVPVIIASAGYCSVMVWNQEGDCIAKVHLSKSTMQARCVSIIDCSRSISGKSWNLSMLIGVEYLNMEEAVAKRNPFLLSFHGEIPDFEHNCIGALFGGIHDTERDADATVLLDIDKVDEADPSRWGRDGSGHTDAISGIFVDEARRRIYTVSYDKSAIMWDAHGKLLSHAEGFHSKKITNGVISDCGTYFATAGLDRACIFKCDKVASDNGPLELRCVARVEYSMSDPSAKRELFACELTPSWFWEKKGFPDCLILGDSGGKINVVPLNLEEGGVLDVIYLNNAAEALPVRHQSGVCRLLWVHQKQADSPEDSEAVAGGKADGQTAALLGGSSSRPLGAGLHLCSTSRDMHIHTYEYQVVSNALVTAKQTAVEDLGDPVGSRGPSKRRTSIGKNSSATVYNSEGTAEKAESVRTIRFHKGPVRGASADGMHSRLVTGGCETLTCWGELGHQVANHRFTTRDSVTKDVQLLMTNVLVVAMQMLRFTTGGEKMDKVHSLEPVRWSTHLCAMDIDDGPLLEYLQRMSTNMDQVVSIWKLFGKPGFFFLVTVTSICLAGPILRGFYEVETKLKYSTETLNLKEKRKLTKWHGRYQLCVGILFSFFVVPLVTSFVGHIDCSQVEGDEVLWYGTQRVMDSRTDVVCFVGGHLVLTVAWFSLITVYLLICAVFDLVNMSISSVLTTRVDGEQAFGKHLYGRSWLRQVLYVAISEILPCRLVSRPRDNIGALTPSKYTATRWFRLLMKIMAPTVLVFQTKNPVRQMVIYSVLTSVNIMLHFYRPPYRNQETFDLVLFVQVVIWIGSVDSLFALFLHQTLLGEEREYSGYIFYLSTCITVALCAFWMKCCGRRRRVSTSLIVRNGLLETFRNKSASADVESSAVRMGGYTGV